MAQFLSGRRTNFNVGVTSVTENTTPLQVIGKVGIGTTTADGRSLYVIGNAEVSGIFTASRIFSSTFGEFTGGTISGTSLVGTSLSVSGISTLSTLGVTGLTTTRDLLVTGITTLSSLGVTGLTTLSSLGVTGLTTTKDLLVTNNFQVNGISTLSSLGVTGLTTTRDLLVTNNLQVNGITTLNAVSAAGTTGISQYVLTSTGTSVIWQSAIALTGVTGFNVAEDTTNTLKYLGMQIGAGTTQVTTISSNQLVYNSTTKNLGIGTTNATSKLTVSGNVLVSGVVTATNFYGNLVGYADRAGIATYADTAGIATYAPNAGIATYAPNSGIATYAPNAGIATYAPNAGIATYAPNAGIATNLKGGAGGSLPYQTAADTTALLANGNVGQLLQSNGTTNAPSWASPQGLTIGFANTAGIATYATNAGIATYATNAGIATYAPNAGIATYAINAGIATSVIGGIASVTQLSVSGVSTVGILTAVSIGIGTTNPTSKLWVNGDAYITGILTASRIFSSLYGEFTGGAISGTNIVGTSLSISGISTLGFITASNAYFTGVVTATTFYGNLNGNASTATYAPNAGIATYAPNAGIATYAVNAGVSTNLLGGVGGSLPYQFSSGITSFVANGNVGQLLQSNGGTSAPSWANPQGLTIGYANTAGIATYATSAGIATYATNAGIATYATNAGIATYATNAGIATYATNAGIATYATNAGIATYATSAGIATYATNAGIATYATNAGIATYATSAGIATYATNAGIATYAPNAGIATYATSAGIATYATNAGIATYAPNAGIATYAPNAGIATYATSAGIATYATNAGIATYATSSGVSTSVIGGIASVTQLSVSGISTLGVTSATNLTAQQLNVSGVSTFAGIATHSASLFGTNASFSGVVTATTFIGNLVGYADRAGIATYAASAGIATYATSSGIATYATSSGIATYATNSGIATYATNAGISTNIKGGAGGSIPYQTAVDTTALLANGSAGNLLQSNGTTLAPSWASPQGLTIGYASTAGIATIATKLQTPRTFEITGDIVGAAVTFDGTGNVSIAATIQPNSVGLGTDTTGDYVQSITGTSNQIDVSVTSGEGSAPILSLPSNLVLPQDVTVTRDLQVTRNLNVTGNVTIGGTSAVIFAQELKISDPDIVLGFRTDAFGNDISNDTTANHGGVALASTEGSPLINLTIAGIETLPATYKKIMWFKAGSFAGLGTDAWLFNYGVGIGSTQFPSGTRLAAGSVQFTENDLAVVRNINSSGIISATQFVGSFNGNAATATYATSAGIATYATSAGIATYATSAGIATYATSAGIATYATNAGIATYATSAGIATYAPNAGIATYATNAGISTNLKGGAGGSIPYQTASDTTALLANGNAGQLLQSNGGTSAPSWSSPGGLTIGYANTAGIATYADRAGIATYATNAGIATYATSAGISTSVIGGIGSITQLQVSGITTSSEFVGGGSDLRNLSGTHLVSYASASDISNSALSIAGISTYNQVGILTGSLAVDASDQFGYSVATSADGKTIVVGAVLDEIDATTGTGVVYVYDRVGSSFNQVGILTGSLAVDASDFFGYSVATSADGKTIIVGAIGDEISGSAGYGLAYVYDRVGSSFNQVGILTGSFAGDTTDYFGQSVATSADGKTIVVGAAFDEIGATTSTGVVYVFDRVGSSFNQVGILTGSLAVDASDIFGWSVATSADGKTIVVGAAFDEIGATTSTGVVYVFDRVGSSFNQVGILTGSLAVDASDIFGRSVATSADGKTIIVGATGDEISGSAGYGLAYVYDRVGSSFNQVGILTGSFAGDTSDFFGRSVATSADGKTIVVGAAFDEIGATTSTGIAYIFKRQGNSFNQVGILTGSLAVDASDQFGISVATSADGKTIIVGAYNDEIGATTGTGVVYVFDETRDTYVYSGPTGNIGIGTTNPTSKLSVIGDVLVSGVVTATQFVGSFSGNVTTATYATNAGIATYATNAGISTYATNAGIATNIKGGAGGSIPYQTASDTTALLANGTSGYVLQANGGTNAPTWVPAAPVNAITGITIRDEGSLVGTALSVSSLNFVGGNIVATASGVGATITISDNLVGTALSISGISTLGTLQVSSGIVTATVGVITYYGDGSKLSGVSGGTSLSISTSVTSQSQYLSFVSGASTSILGISTLSQPLVFTPSTGNLGIGTTNPLQKLHVLGNLLVAAGSSTGQHITQKAYELNNGTLSWEGTAGQLFSITNNLTSGSIFSVNDVSGIPSIDVDANGTVSMVSYGGSVGIGTTLASQKLHVQGNVRISGGLYDSNNNVGTAGSVLSSTGSGLSWIAGGGVSISTNTTNQSQYLTYVTGTGSTTGFGVSLTGLVFNPSSNSLGIGTTNPTEKLQVQGNISINGTTSYGSTTATTATVSQTNIYSGLPSATYRSVEYTIQATQGTNYHATKILTIHNGTLAYNSEYGTIYNNTLVGAFDVDISGGNIRLLVTPASSSSTTYTVNFVATKI